MKIIVTKLKLNLLLRMQLRLLAPTKENKQARVFMGAIKKPLPEVPGTEKTGSFLPQAPPAVWEAAAIK